MITKQEIIDYIEDNLTGGDDAIIAVETAIQMIKDLKPRVKKLEWTSSNSTSLCGKYYWDDIDGYVSDYSRYDGETNYLGLFDYVSQAQEACQKHYEETILGKLEDET